MFKNRYAIETKVIKKSKDQTQTEEVERITLTDLAPIVRENVETIAIAAVVLVGSYVLLDTIRQVAVKITPQH